MPPLLLLGLPSPCRAGVLPLFLPGLLSLSLRQSIVIKPPSSFKAGPLRRPPAPRAALVIPMPLSSFKARASHCAMLPTYSLH
jgi:hypothetical protein